MKIKKIHDLIIKNNKRNQRTKIIIKLVKKQSDYTQREEGRGGERSVLYMRPIQKEEKRQLNIYVVDIKLKTTIVQATLGKTCCHF